MGLTVPLAITALATIFAIPIAWASGWNWNASSAIFTSVMTGATMWMAWEAQVSRKEATRVRRTEALKSALVEVTDRNYIVVGILKGLNAKGTLMQKFLTGDVQSGIEYLRVYPETVELLQRVEVPANTSRYVLGAVHKMKGLVAAFEEDIGRAFELKSEPHSTTLKRLQYLHLILVQLGRVLLVEAKKLGIKEAQKWEALLELSPFVKDLKPEEISSVVEVYPPLGRLSLPAGKEYETLSFSKLVEEARKKEHEPVDGILWIREA